MPDKDLIHGQPRKPGLPELIVQARDGDLEAAQKLFDAFTHVFKLEIRFVISPSVCRLMDSLDILQEMRMVLLKPLPSEVYASECTFMRYFKRMARNFTLKANRQYLDVARNNLKRDVPLGDILNTIQEPGASSETWKEEMWEYLLENEGTEIKEIVSFVRQGCSHQELADKRGISVSTVYRMLEDFRRRMIEKLE